MYLQLTDLHRKTSITGWYLTGGRGNMSPSLDFGVPLTGIDSVIPGWDAFNPPHWSLERILSVSQ